MRFASPVLSFPEKEPHIPCMLAKQAPLSAAVPRKNAFAQRVAQEQRFASRQPDRRAPRNAPRAKQTLPSIEIVCRKPSVAQTTSPRSQVIRPGMPESEKICRAPARGIVTSVLFSVSFRQSAYTVPARSATSSTIPGIGSRRSNASDRALSSSTSPLSPAATASTSPLSSSDICCGLTPARANTIARRRPHPAKEHCPLPHKESSAARHPEKSACSAYPARLQKARSAQAFARPAAKPYHPSYLRKTHVPRMRTACPRLPAEYVLRLLAPAAQTRAPRRRLRR